MLWYPDFPDNCNSAKEKGHGCGTDYPEDNSKLEKSWEMSEERGHNCFQQFLPGHIEAAKYQELPLSFVLYLDMP